MSSHPRDEFTSPFKPDSFEEALRVPASLEGEYMNTIKSALCAATLLCLTSAAQAQGTGSEGYFQIYNNTEGNVVVGFYTNDGDGWSDNWLGDNLVPGENARAEFYADSGNCDQVFQVGWLGENDEEVLDEPIAIDICEASNVYLDDNEIYFD